MDMQNYTTPFANTGDREEFSIGTDPSGKVSLEKGWTELYQLRPEEGGLFILRKVFNQMMKLVSTDTVTWKTQTFPNWIDDKGDGLPFTYPKNALVKYTDGNTYVSLVNSNTSIPTDTNNWVNFEDFGSLDINGLPEKITPSNDDNLALQETGGLLKKLSFTNLKIWILSLFNPSITGTVSFNSTTNNIQLTNIVTSLGLELGDVIQISGAEDAKNNSEFTVEVITDNNNIIVNQAHANKGTSKNVANRAGDTGVSIKLLCKWYNAPLGLGQGLVDVTSNRTTGVNYPTQPNRAIKVSIRTTSTTTAKFIALDLNGERVNAVENYGSGGPWALALSETIPSGSTYRLNVINDLGKWMEYR